MRRMCLWRGVARERSYPSYEMSEERCGHVDVEIARISAEHAVQRMVAAMAVLTVRILVERRGVRRGLRQKIDAHELGRDGVQYERLEPPRVIELHRGFGCLAECPCDGPQGRARGIPPIGDGLGEIGRATV